MLTVKYTKLFEKDYKLLKKRGLNLELLQDVVAILANKQELPEKYKDHYLEVIDEIDEEDNSDDINDSLINIIGKIFSEEDQKKNVLLHQYCLY